MSSHYTDHILLAIDASSVIRFGGRWVFVPLMFAGMLAFAAYLAFNRVASEEQQFSNIMSFAVGAIGFGAIIILDSLDMIGNIKVLQEGQSLKYALGGFAAAILLLVIADKFLQSKARSAFIIPVTFASLTGFYFYLLEDQYRTPVLLILLGVIGGAVIYGWLFSSSLLTIMKPTRRRTPARAGAAGRRS